MAKEQKADRQQKAPDESSTAASDTQNERARAWAKEHGYDVNDRGRVPADIREAFEKSR